MCLAYEGPSYQDVPVHGLDAVNREFVIAEISMRAIDPISMYDISTKWDLSLHKRSKMSLKTEWS